MTRDASWATVKRIQQVYEIGSGKTAYPHQVEGVHKVLRAIERGTQKRFLHYYAPRTGKTLVQASLAYWLMRLSEDIGIGLVVIVNDREFLDSQSFEVVQTFMMKMRMAAAPWKVRARVIQADSTKELREVLASCERSIAEGEQCQTILFTTFQKLNSSELIWTRASDALARKTLVMPDEVHRSHTEFGSMTLAMERVLGASYYVALTGTPNKQALERFGTLGADGLRRPFHAYHLGQAVSEGLVMDPRTEYHEVVSIVSGLDDSCISDQEKSRLRRLMSASSGRDMLTARVRLVLEHFHSTCDPLSYRAQGLVLCASRQDVLDATKIARMLARRNPELDFQDEDILGAFSGSVSGETEKDLNGFFMRSAMDAKRAKILFVAHKFETGYDNPAVTCLYMCRKIDTSTLATQVLLRHCSKRPGKIRPITIDFANQDGQILSAMSMYFGDVVCHPTGVVRKEVTRNDHRAQVQSSSRKVIEKHLLGRIRLDRLELRPVATPARCQSAPGSISLNQQRGSEVTPSESHSNIMLLKVMLPGQQMNTLERAALAALSKKAATGHLGTLKALSNAGASLAMKKVLINGEKRDRAMVKSSLEELQKADFEAKKLLELMTSIDSVKSDGAGQCFKAVTTLRALLAEDDSKILPASRLNACSASLDALTRFNSFELDFGESFGSFSTPFFAGRNAEFYTQIWGLLDQLSSADEEAARAVNAKKSVDSLNTVDEAALADASATSVLLEKLRHAMASASPSLRKAMKDEMAVDGLRRVMAFGMPENVKVAEGILQSFSNISEDAFRLAQYRTFLDIFSRSTAFTSEDCETLRNLFEKAFPKRPSSPFMFGFPGLHLGNSRISPDLDGQIIRRFGLEDVGRQLVRHGQRNLGAEILNAFQNEERPVKRLRNV